MCLIAKGFGPTRSGRRERSGPIAPVQACGQVGTLDVLVYEAGVEAVTGSDRIDAIDRYAGTRDLLWPSARQRTLNTQLHDHQRNHTGKAGDGPGLGCREMSAPRGFGSVRRQEPAFDKEQSAPSANATILRTFSSVNAQSTT